VPVPQLQHKVKLADKVLSNANIDKLNEHNHPDGVVAHRRFRKHAGSPSRYHFSYVGIETVVCSAIDGAHGAILRRMIYVDNHKISRCRVWDLKNWSKGGIFTARPLIISQEQ
jgi:hypothetical protein